MGFLRNWQRGRLYKQWVDKEGLSPEDLPADLKKDKRDSVETNDNSNYEISPAGEFRPRMGQQVDSLFTSTNVRFILIMALIIVVLLVTLSVLLTILVMRGC